MSNGFMHGVEVIDIDAGQRPIEGVSASVIGLLGVALKGPVNTPTLIASRTAGEEAFGTDGTIGPALRAIYEQASAQVVVVNALDPSNDKVSVPAADYELDGDSVQLGHQYVINSSLVVMEEFNIVDRDLSLTGDTLNVGQVNISNVVVEDSAGSTTYTLATDYTVVAATGVISRVTTGSISAGAALKVSYDYTLTYELTTDYTVDAAAGSLTRVADGGIDANATLNVAYDYLATAQVTDAELVKAAGKFVEAESVTGRKPRILVAPGYTEHVSRTDADSPITAAPVTTGLIAVAERIRAVIVADGPNTTNADALVYRGLLSNRRVYIVDPGVRITDAAGDVSDAPASARIAGLIVRNDRDRGYWSSPSNRQVLGISGTSRVVDFTLGDAASGASLLNEDEVATIIRSPLGGYRLWGNRTTSADAKWAFLPVVRTADVINESLLRAHLWAVDRNLTKTYVEDVVESVNDFLRRLIAQGAILSGRCWADEGLNTASAREAGRVYFNFEFDPPSPAERITFRSHLVSGEVA